MGMLSFDALFSKEDWLADSGTSSHIATQCEMFVTFNPEPSKVGGFGEDMALEATGRGTVTLMSTVDGQQIHTTLQDVLYVPKALNCLLAVGKIDAKGGIMNFADGNVNVKQPNGHTRITGKLIW